MLSTVIKQNSHWFWLVIAALLVGYDVRLFLADAALVFHPGDEAQEVIQGWQLVGWLVPLLVLGAAAGFLLSYSDNEPEPELEQLKYENGQLEETLAAHKAGIAERDRDLEKLREQLRENESTLRFWKGGLDLDKSLERSGNAQEASKRMKEIQGLQMAESRRLLAMALNASSTDEQRQAALQQLHYHLHHPPTHKGRIKRVKTKKEKGGAVDNVPAHSPQAV